MCIYIYIIPVCTLSLSLHTCTRTNAQYEKNTYVRRMCKCIYIYIQCVQYIYVYNIYTCACTCRGAEQSPADYHPCMWSCCLVSHFVLSTASGKLSLTDRRRWCVECSLRAPHSSPFLQESCFLFPLLQTAMRKNQLRVPNDLGRFAAQETRSFSNRRVVVGEGTCFCPNRYFLRLVWFGRGYVQSHCARPRIGKKHSAILWTIGLPIFYGVSTEQQLMVHSKVMITSPPIRPGF